MYGRIYNLNQGFFSIILVFLFVILEVAVLIRNN